MYDFKCYQACMGQTQLVWKFELKGAIFFITFGFEINKMKEHVKISNMLEIDKRTMKKIGI
jgi:hypothetical protein